MNKIKIAQIGTSLHSHGNGIWSRLLKNNDLFDVVGYAFPENEKERFPKNAEAFRAYREMTVEEILNDPEIEAVAVETEEKYLTKYALMVAEAGKHLHMEKPGGLVLEDFERLIETLKQKKLAFSMGYMYRFNPMIQEAIQKVQNGELGRVFAVEAHMSLKHSCALRQWLEGFSGGMTFFLGCHLIDLIYRIQGEPDEVIPLSCSTGIDGLTTDDYGMVVFKYSNGVSFAKTCDNERGGFQRRQLVICGEKGTIEIRPIEVTVKGEGQYTISNENFSLSGKNSVSAWETRQSDMYDRYDAMIRNFAELVRGKENPYSYDYELNLYKLILRSCGMEISEETR